VTSAARTRAKSSGTLTSPALPTCVICPFSTNTTALATVSLPTECSRPAYTASLPGDSCLPAGGIAGTGAAVSGFTGSGAFGNRSGSASA